MKNEFDSQCAVSFSSAMSDEEKEETTNSTRENIVYKLKHSLELNMTY